MNISSETLDFYIKNSRKSLDELQKDIKDIKLFMSGNKQPTFGQVSDIARKLNIPTGLLMLDRPVEIKNTKLDFRTLDSIRINTISEELRDTIVEMETKQDFLREEIDFTLDFIKSFSTLLDSWVLLLESIKTSSRVVPNLAYKREIVRIKNEVEFWLTISRSIWLNLTYEDWVYLNKYFPEEFAYIVSTWEETWTLSESIKKIWVNYNKELKRYISNLSTMIEPFIIVVVWAMVGTIVIAIMLPFFQLWKVVQNM